MEAGDGARGNRSRKRLLAVLLAVVVILGGVGAWFVLRPGEPQPTVPTAPRSLAATAGDTNVSLTWQPPSADGGSPVTSYRIYRGNASATEAPLATVGPLLAFDDEGLTNGVAYFYEVSAINAVGEGPRSAEVSATPATRPSAPWNLAAVPGDANATLTWQTPASDGGLPVTNYTVYRGSVSGGETFLTRLRVVSSFADLGLTNGVPYYYEVSASNGVGEGPRSGEVRVTPAAPASVPSAPRNLAARPGEGRALLAWQPPASDGGSSPTNYTIYRGASSGAESFLATVGNVTAYADLGLPGGVPCYYQVSATNAIGEGPRSGEAMATPNATALVIGTSERETTFDPADAFSYWSENFLRNTMATLLTYNESGDGTLAPMLVAAVPTVANGGISVDGMTYTLHLRTGETFQDGTAIDATVAKYAIDRAVKAKPDPFFPALLRDPEPSFLLDPLAGVPEYRRALANLTSDPANHTQAEVDAAWTNYTQRGVVVLDAVTLQLHLRYAWAPMSSLLAFTSLAPVNPVAYPMDEFRPLATSVSASGPYRVVSFVAGERMELAANPAFLGTPPDAPRLVLRFFGDRSSLNAAMRDREIDVAFKSLDPVDFDAFRTDTNVITAQGPDRAIRFLGFNARDPPFDDVRLRQAFAYAVDRPSLVQTALLDAGVPLYSLLPTGVFGHQDVFATRYPRDFVAARQLLVAAGYDETNRLNTTLWYTPTHYGADEASVARALELQLEATGMIDVTVSSQEWGMYRAGLASGSFPVFLLGWYPDYLDPDDYATPLLSSSTSSSFGSFYANATMDALLALQVQQNDPAQRAQTLGQIQSILAEDVPYLPLWQAPQQVVYRRGITGVLLDASGFFRYFTIALT